MINFFIYIFLKIKNIFHNIPLKLLYTSQIDLFKVLNYCLRILAFETLLLLYFFSPILNMVIEPVLKLVVEKCSTGTFTIDKLANISSTLISVTFTILGFSITLKNILISKESVQFSNFSMKTLTEKGTEMWANYFWYLIMMIPVFSILNYISNNTIQLCILVAISLCCILLYFHSIIICLTEKNKIYIISNIFVNQTIIPNNDNFEEIFDLFKKLCSNSNSQSSTIIRFKIFRKYYDSIINILSNKNFEQEDNIFEDDDTSFFQLDNLSKKRNIIKKLEKTKKSKTYIEYRIHENLSEFYINKNHQLYKKISTYVFYYFFFTINNNLKESTEIPTIHKSYNDSIYKNEINTILSKGFDLLLNENPLDTASNEYSFFMNSILGIFVAILTTSNIDFFDTVLNDIIENLNKQSSKIPLSCTKIEEHIYCLSIISINFVLSNKLYKNQKRKKLFDFYKNYQSKVYENDFKNLSQILYEDFNILQNNTSLKSILDNICEKYETHYTPDPLI